jgi:hypothetical protein
MTKGDLSNRKYLDIYRVKSLMVKNYIPQKLNLSYKYQLERSDSELKSDIWSKIKLMLIIIFLLIKRNGFKDPLLQPWWAIRRRTSLPSKKADFLSLHPNYFSSIWDHLLLHI